MRRLTVLLSGIVMSLMVYPAVAQEVYKLQIASDGRSGLSLPIPIPLPVPVPIDTSRQEWVVVTVADRQVTLRHTTSIANMIGLRTWFDHPATSVRLCRTHEFELLDCSVAEGDTALLPEGATIYDVMIEFKYVESGLIHTHRFQLAEEFQPERG